MSVKILSVFPEPARDISRIGCWFFLSIHDAKGLQPQQRFWGNAELRPHNGSQGKVSPIKSCWTLPSLLCLDGKWEKNMCILYIYIYMSAPWEKWKGRGKEREKEGEGGGSGGRKMSYYVYHHLLLGIFFRLIAFSAVFAQLALIGPSQEFRFLNRHM